MLGRAAARIPQKKMGNCLSKVDKSLYEVLKSIPKSRENSC